MEGNRAWALQAHYTIETDYGTILGDATSALWPSAFTQASVANTTFLINLAAKTFGLSILMLLVKGVAHQWVSLRWNRIYFTIIFVMVYLTSGYDKMEAWSVLLSSIYF